LPPGTEALTKATKARYPEKDSPVGHPLTHEELYGSTPYRTHRITNPKDIEAQTRGKTRLDLLEPVAERAIADALAFGANKYGVRNYVTARIEARVYVAAMKRHIDAWLEGEDIAEDSGVHHLGHIGANVHVVLAAIEAGAFVDNRHESAPNDNPINGAFARAVDAEFAKDRTSIATDATVDA